MDAVWKKFRRGERHDSLRDLVPAAVRRVLRGAAPASELQQGDFWALRDVTFEIRKGDALGVIGHNGAGKSTLLKILLKSGTTVIFVSHHMDAVLSLCNSALLLDHGTVTVRGELMSVVGEYYKSGGQYKPKIFDQPRATTVDFSSTMGTDLVVAPGERIAFTHTIGEEGQRPHAWFLREPRGKGRRRHDVCAHARVLAEAQGR
ncbi:MAG: ATP-binding cassette domain-containing protein [Gemmatimonadaceae bacterium]